MTVRSTSFRLLPDTDRAIEAAAQTIIELVKGRPDAILGLATGGTMEPLYGHLVTAHHDGLSFARVRTVNLDEYVGLSPDHPNSYHSYMAQHFFDHVDVAEQNIYIPQGEIEPAQAAHKYSALLERLGPVDLQLLGIGANGHIGFNEPGTAVDAPTRVVELLPSTIKANARFFSAGDVVPSHAVTMGTAEILSARSIVALATGAAKARALADALDGTIGPDCPASYLRLHANCTIFADKLAGAELQELGTPSAA
ncbi:glucosamine-6-phosphate deaminase [Paracoccus aestuariivivens]|uniref:Glucosamine-6-phosphate deaminase n=1 Tax=Paracoccus aestuariivivens TaxID=1820333 RepID=A0A6L6J8K3_9RHOB|nr:glucosamine-6-phosphate deaminase [Paracoccus aestuariivivens]MTH76967.1 glucosamine-6-phosphate deaminase [Paracoccus aestuariivivens]